MAIQDDYQQATNAVILKVYSNRMELSDPRHQLQITQIAAQPYSNQRTLIANFDQGEHLTIILLTQWVKQRSSFLAFSPVILLQAMDLCEGGLTQVEFRALREMALSAGARFCVVYEANGDVCAFGMQLSQELKAPLISKPFIMVLSIIGLLIAALLIFLLVVQ